MSDQEGLLIGPPRRLAQGDPRERWVVNLTRRLDNPEDTFDGVVGVALSLKYLLVFYDALGLGDCGAVGLLTTEGILVARSPFEDDFIGRDLSNDPLFSKYLQVSDRGGFAATYRTDGMRRLTAFRHVADHCAVVYVGLGEEEVLAAWRRRLIFFGLPGTLTLALFMRGSLVVMRYTARQQEWQRQRSHRLKLLANEAIISETPRVAFRGA